VAAVAAAVAGCGGGGDLPPGVSRDFQRQAIDACSRAVGAIGIVDFTSLPDPRALARISQALRESAVRVRGARVTGRDDREVQTRLSAGFENAASAVDLYLMGVRDSAPDEQRYSRMVSALGDMGSEGQRAGTDACVAPTEA
jgi:hypothetical protein